MAVPVIDISPFLDGAAHDDPARRAAAAQWDHAMTEVGFAFIVGHGVAQETISDLRSGAMDFFSQDSKAKLAYSYGPYGNPLGGYTGMGTEAVSRTRDEHGMDGGVEDTASVVTGVPDLVESFIYKPESPKPQPAALTTAGCAYFTELLRVLGWADRFWP